MAGPFAGLHGVLKLTPEGLSDSVSFRVVVVEAQDVSSSHQSGKLLKYRLVVETVGSPYEHAERDGDRG